MLLNLLDNSWLNFLRLTVTFEKERYKINTRPGGGEVNGVSGGSYLYIGENSTPPPPPTPA